MSRSAPQLQRAESRRPTKPATVLEGIGREMTPSADGRSLPGASSTEPPPSFARQESQRRRNLVYVAFGIILLVGAGLGFAFGNNENRRPAPPSRRYRCPIPAPTPRKRSTQVVTTPAAPIERATTRRDAPRAQRQRRARSPHRGQALTAGTPTAKPSAIRNAPQGPVRLADPQPRLLNAWAATLAARTSAEDCRGVAGPMPERSRLERAAGGLCDDGRDRVAGR